MDTPTPVDPSEALRLARRTAETAVPFADQLAARCGAIAASLRRGEDHSALSALADATEDLEHFLKFLVLICDYVDPMDASASTHVRTYRQQLIEVVESLQPSLGHLDLVEVADALEDDLVPMLRDYRQVDEGVQAALHVPVTP
jgi:hypothetical protein